MKNRIILAALAGLTVVLAATAWAQFGGQARESIFIPPIFKLVLGTADDATAVVVQKTAANEGTWTGKIKLATGVSADGGGFKHQRLTTGSCATTGCSVTVTWTTAFADTAYTVSCSVQEATAQSETSGLRIAKIQAPAAASVAVELDNNAAGALTGTLHCVGIHD